MATKKKLKKMISRLAKTMPVILDQTHEEHVVEGMELIEQGQTEINEDKKVDPAKKYLQKMPVLLSRNHENRIKQAYKKHGRDGVTSYIREVKSVIAANA